MIIADRFAEQTRNVERAFISAAWLDPIAGNNAAVDASLAGSRFYFPEHIAVFFYACRCAEVDATPDIPECVRAMHAAGLALNWSDRVAEQELYELIMSYTKKSGTLDDLAGWIVHLHNERKEFETAHAVMKRILSRVQRQCVNDRNGRRTSRLSNLKGAIVV